METSRFQACFEAASRQTLSLVLERETLCVSNALRFSGAAPPAPSRGRGSADFPSAAGASHKLYPFQSAPGGPGLFWGTVRTSAATCTTAVGSLKLNRRCDADQGPTCVRVSVAGVRACRKHPGTLWSVTIKERRLSALRVVCQRWGLPPGPIPSARGGSLVVCGRRGRRADAKHFCWFVALGRNLPTEETSQSSLRAVCAMGLALLAASGVLVWLVFR